MNNEYLPHITDIWNGNCQKKPNVWWPAIKWSACHIWIIQASESCMSRVTDYPLGLTLGRLPRLPPILSLHISLTYKSHVRWVVYLGVSPKLWELIPFHPNPASRDFGRSYFRTSIALRLANLLAMLVALHFTPVSHSLGRLVVVSK